MKPYLKIIIYSLLLGIACFLIVFLTGRKVSRSDYEKHATRFFSDSSFWNLPVQSNPEIDPNSERWISMLKQEPTGENFGISYSKWTIPVYEVDSLTPVYEIKKCSLTEGEKIHWNTERDTFGHGPGFKYVPIPDGASADPQEDAHMALVDYKRNVVWDMLSFHKLPDGSFESKTGMKYSLNGTGIFNTSSFNIIDGESIHFHGPGRASGVPIIAGLIMYNEVISGEIRHKLSWASRYGALHEFVFPACWTDGTLEGGIPEGAVIQLDPALDLSAYGLTKEESIVARAMQKYGMVLVDMAQGQPIYAEGLWGHPDKSWKGKLREWDGGINSIPYEKFRILKITNPVNKGDLRSKFKPLWTQP